MNFLIRSGHPDDAEGVAYVHVKAWQETYGFALPQAQLDAMDPVDRVDRWRSILRGDDNQSSFVATHNDEVIGWATFGHSRDDDRVGELELYAIYVLAAWHGTGVAQALMEAFLENNPSTETTLWVMEGNDRAVKFYRKQGFHTDGTVKVEQFWGVSITELRMLRPSDV